MKKNVINIIIGICLLLFAVFNSYYLTHLYSYDEIWIYGFGANILDGLIPYKDFSLVVPPFFPYLLSVVFGIFGKKLIIYHIVIAMMVLGIVILASRKIKWYSILIYLAMLIYSINGYNTCSLLLLFILLTLLDKEDDKYNDIIIPIIVSIMIFTKQTLVLLTIPSLIYSKNKKKTILTYLVMFLIFLVYLISHNNLFQFLDYCLFGMFEFADENKLTLPVYLILEIIIVIGLIINLVRSKWKRKDIFYVLLYQIITMPILEIYHFVLGWSSVVYLIFKSKRIGELDKKFLFGVFMIIELLLLFTTNTLFTVRDFKYYEHYPRDSYLSGRFVPEITDSFVDDVANHIDKYGNRELYLFGNFSYLIKLELDIPINKYDLINNGNMGYKGAYKYIEEIDKTCSKKKCLFIVNDAELSTKLYTQTNRDILLYVMKNYTKEYSSSVYGVYVN